jgi:uncharacterized protein (DUF58 family)
MAALPFYRSIYLTRYVYYAGFAAAGLFVLSFFSPVFFTIAYAVLLFTAIAVLIDGVLLYSRKGMVAERLLPDRFSNGDPNKIGIQFSNSYPFAVQCTVIDELPFQFQERAWQRRVEVGAEGAYLLTYTLTPLTRGNYSFGYINVYVRSPLRMVQRRCRSGQPATIPVYPSYVQMRQHQLSAIGNTLQQAGTKRIRRLGHSTEFEQIKEYVPGDDYRTVNWKATARQGGLMVNTYTDERSQQVYCIVNKGRVMKLPFNGMTLLDYAINGNLALLNVALRKGDKAGLITYAQQVDTFLAADKKTAQLNHLLEALYNEQTHFSEPDNEALFSAIRNKITQRSLLILFTNFESFESLERQMPFLKRIAHYHLLVVVFFENTELKALTEGNAKTIEDIYIHTIAEKYRHEKRRMVKELHQQGIVAVLTTPQQLTVNTLNKYLELKSRQSL